MGQDLWQLAAIAGEKGIKQHNLQWLQITAGREWITVNKILSYLKDPKVLFFGLAKRGWLNWMPDKTYVRLGFRLAMKQRLNLKDPKTFSEKLQWLKLHDRKPEYTRMVDKYEAKQYIAQRVGEEYVIPTYGVWDNFDEIDFDTLPSQFVLKCTHDSGGLVICRDKTKLDLEKARNKITASLKCNYFWSNREWPYKNVKPRIIAEKLMWDERQQTSLVDYKFYCLNGEPKFLYISEGLEDHSTARISFVNPDWTPAPFRRTDYKPFEQLPPKPKHYDTMLAFAKKLSAEIPFLRVDMYEVDGKLYFSELTFFPTSGYTHIHPEHWDRKLGDWLTLP